MLSFVEAFPQLSFELDCFSTKAPVRTPGALLQFLQVFIGGIVALAVQRSQPTLDSELPFLLLFVSQTFRVSWNF